MACSACRDPADEVPIPVQKRARRVVPADHRLKERDAANPFPVAQALEGAAGVEPDGAPALPARHTAAGLVQPVPGWHPRWRDHRCRRREDTGTWSTANAARILVAMALCDVCHLADRDPGPHQGLHRGGEPSSAATSSRLLPQQAPPQHSRQLQPPRVRANRSLSAQTHIEI